MRPATVRRRARQRPACSTRCQAPPAAKRIEPAGGSGCHSSGTGAPGLGRGVQDEAVEVGPRDAVDHAVVDLGQQRPAAVGQSLAEPVLPERAVAVHAPGHHPAHQPADLGRPARSGQSGVADVPAQVEARVVDPRRGREVERARCAASAGSAGSEADVRRWPPRSRRRPGAGPSKTANEPIARDAAGSASSASRKAAASGVRRSTTTPPARGRAPRSSSLAGVRRLRPGRRSRNAGTKRRPSDEQAERVAGGVGEHVEGLAPSSVRSSRSCAPSSSARARCRSRASRLDTRKSRCSCIGTSWLGHVVRSRRSTSWIATTRARPHRGAPASRRHRHRRRSAARPRAGSAVRGAAGRTPPARGRRSCRSRCGSDVGSRPSSPSWHAPRDVHRAEDAETGRSRRTDPVRGSPGWTRTNNPSINSRMLCQLSYRGSFGARTD